MVFSEVDAGGRAATCPTKLFRMRAGDARRVICRDGGPDGGKDHRSVRVLGVFHVKEPLTKKE